MRPSAPLLCAHTHQPRHLLISTRSPPYAAPELFQGIVYEGPEVDIWSLGVILFTLVAGALPFDGADLKELRERVIRGKYRVPFFMTTECEAFLRLFLVSDPTRRATIDEVMVHPWLNTGCEMLIPHHPAGVRPSLALCSFTFTPLVAIPFFFSDRCCFP